MTNYTTELGETGLGGARPFDGHVYDEFLPQLRGWRGAQKYREMSDNDPVVGALLFAIEMLILSVDWRLEMPDNAGREAVKDRQWLEDVLFHGLTQPFHEVVGEALSALTFGFAPLEIVLKKRKDGTVGVHKLPIRAQETVWRWEFDEAGTPLHMEQFRLAHPVAKIPMEKLLLFRTKSRRNNPEGRSLLRNAFIPYERKNELELAEGRSVKRAAGIVDLAIPGKYLDPTSGPNERAMGDAYKRAAAQMAADRVGFFVRPSDRDDKGNAMVELKFVGADNRNPGDAANAIDRYNRMIAMVAMADFLLMGQKEIGSLALASSKTSLFARATGGSLKMIEGPFNRQLIPLLWKLNGKDPDTMPKLKAGDLETPDLAELGAYITSLSGAGMPLFPTEDGQLEETLLGAANLPKSARAKAPEAPAIAAPDKATQQARATAKQDGATGAEPPKGEEVKGDKTGVQKFRAWLRSVRDE